MCSLPVNAILSGHDFLMGCLTLKLASSLITLPFHKRLSGKTKLRQIKAKTGHLEAAVTASSLNCSRLVKKAGF